MDLVAYLVLALVGVGAIGTIAFALSRRNAYRADGIDNLGGVIRRWADRRVEANRSIAREYARRADEQHAKFLGGDDAGVFGDYPPHLT